jgi:hypothetical protein
MSRSFDPEAIKALLLKWERLSLFQGNIHNRITRL